MVSVHSTIGITEIRMDRYAFTSQTEYAARSYWPFPLTRIDNAEEECTERHIVIEQIGQTAQRGSHCAVCGDPARVTHWVINAEVNVASWLADAFRKGDGRTINYRQHANACGEPQPFCSRECYASYVLWSLYVPVTDAQRFASFYIVPRWIIGNILTSP